MTKEFRQKHALFFTNAYITKSVLLGKKEVAVQTNITSFAAGLRKIIMGSISYL